jgi:hypothetical protein
MTQENNLDNVIDNFEQYEKISDKEIFTKIWTSPTEVFKYVVAKKYRQNFFVALLLLAGISNTFGQAFSRNMGDDISLLGIFLFCIIFGALIGWVPFYIYAALMSWTGKWLKGKGNTNSILTVICFAMIPSIVGLVLLIPQIGVLGNDLFKADNFESTDLGVRIFVMFIGILEAILLVWTIVLLIIGISVVQKISIGKSILNLLLPALIILVPLMIIVMITIK